MDSILIRYRAEGIGELSSAFDTIEKRITRLTAAAQAGASSRTRAARTESSEFIAAKTAEQKAADKAENDHTKATERESRRRQSIVDNSAKYAGKLAEQQAKLELKAEQDATSALEREARARDRIRERSASMAGRYASQQADAEISARRRVGSMVGGAVTQGTGRVLGGIASLGGMAFGALGAFSVADAVRGRYKAEESAAQIVNAVTAGGVTPQGANVASIVDQAGGVAVKTGMSKDEIAQGTLAYVRSTKGGDFGGAMANMEFFAKLAKTTGTDINEIGKAAGTLQSQNPDLKAPEMQQMLLNAYEMSKSGSVSLSESAKQFGVLGSTRGMYAGDAGKNQRTLLALGQLAAPGGSSEEIGTYIKDVSTEALRHSKQLKAMGVKFEGGKMTSPEDMLAKAFSGTGGNLGALEKIFGLRGMPLITQLEPAYTKAAKAAGGGEAGKTAGENAIRQEIAGVANATMTPDQLNAQFAEVMSTSAEKFAVAIESIRDKVEAKVVPYLDMLADKLGDPRFMANIDGIIDAGGKLAQFFMNNPFAGIGGVVLLSITKELAAAGIGIAVKEVILKLLAGETVAPVVKGLLGAGAGASGVGGAVAVSAAVGYLGYSIDKANTDKSEKKLGDLLQEPKSEEERIKKNKALSKMVDEAKQPGLLDIAKHELLPFGAIVNAGLAVHGGRQDVTGTEAAAARLDEAAVIKKHAAEIDAHFKKFGQSLSDATDRLHGTASITDPNHPNRSPPIQ